MPNHLIQRQLVELRVRDPKTRRAIEVEIEFLLTNQVWPALEQICSSLEQAGQTIRIDRLIIDLGEIAASELKTRWPEEVIRGFERSLSLHVQQVRALTPKPALEGSHGTGLTPLESGVEESRTLPRLRFDALRYYLHHGTLPWWWDDDQGDIQALWDNLVSDREPSLRSLLRSSLSDATVRQRLSLQLNSTQVRHLIEWVFDRPSASAPFIQVHDRLLRSLAPSIVVKPPALALLESLLLAEMETAAQRLRPGEEPLAGKIQSLSTRHSQPAIDARAHPFDVISEPVRPTGFHEALAEHSRLGDSMTRRLSLLEPSAADSRRPGSHGTSHLQTPPPGTPGSSMGFATETSLEALAADDAARLTKGEESDAELRDATAAGQLFSAMHPSNTTASRGLAYVTPSGVSSFGDTLAPFVANEPTPGPEYAHETPGATHRAAHSNDAVTGSEPLIDPGEQTALLGAADSKSESPVRDTPVGVPITEAKGLAAAAQPEPETQASAEKGDFYRESSSRCQASADTTSDPSLEAQALGPDVNRPAIERGGVHSPPSAKVPSSAAFVQSAADMRLQADFTEPNATHGTPRSNPDPDSISVPRVSSVTSLTNDDHPALAGHPRQGDVVGAEGDSELSLDFESSRQPCHSLEVDLPPDFATSESKTDVAACSADAAVGPARVGKSLQETPAVSQSFDTPTDVEPSLHSGLLQNVRPTPRKDEEETLGDFVEGLTSSRVKEPESPSPVAANPAKRSRGPEGRPGQRKDDDESRRIGAPPGLTTIGTEADMTPSPATAGPAERRSPARPSATTIEAAADSGMASAQASADPGPPQEVATPLFGDSHPSQASLLKDKAATGMAKERSTSPILPEAATGGSSARQKARAGESREHASIATLSSSLAPLERPEELAPVPAAVHSLTDLAGKTEDVSRGHPNPGSEEMDEERQGVDSDSGDSLRAKTAKANTDAPPEQTFERCHEAPWIVPPSPCQAVEQRSLLPEVAAPDAHAEWATLNESLPLFHGHSAAVTEESSVSTRFRSGISAESGAPAVSRAEMAVQSGLSEADASADPHPPFAGELPAVSARGSAEGAAGDTPKEAAGLPTADQIQSTQLRARMRQQLDRGACPPDLRVSAEVLLGDDDAQTGALEALQGHASIAATAFSSAPQGAPEEFFPLPAAVQAGGAEDLGRGSPNPDHNNMGIKRQDTASVSDDSRTPQTEKADVAAHPEQTIGRIQEVSSIAPLRAGGAVEQERLLPEAAVSGPASGAIPGSDAEMAGRPRIPEAAASADPLPAQLSPVLPAGVAATGAMVDPPKQDSAPPALDQIEATQLRARMPQHLDRDACPPDLRVSAEVLLGDDEAQTGALEASQGHASIAATAFSSALQGQPEGFSPFPAAVQSLPDWVGERTEDIGRGSPNSDHDGTDKECQDAALVLDDSLIPETEEADVAARPEQTIGRISDVSSVAPLRAGRTVEQETLLPQATASGAQARPAEPDTSPCITNRCVVSTRAHSAPPVSSADLGPSGAIPGSDAEMAGRPRIPEAAASADPLPTQLSPVLPAGVSAAGAMVDPLKQDSAPHAFDQIEARELRARLYQLLVRSASPPDLRVSAAALLGDEAAAASADSSGPLSSPPLLRIKRPPELPPPPDAHFYTGVAGLVLLWPFLPLCFKTLNLAVAREFKSEAASHRAVHILHYLAAGKEEAPEPALLLPKILCGLPWSQPVPAAVGLTEEEKAEADALLKAAIGHWSVLRNISLPGFRRSFLARTGRLTQAPAGSAVGGWELHIERQGHDILLDQLPWALSLIKLPWLAEFITVQW